MDLKSLRLDLSMPFNGSVQCGLLKRQKNIDITIGNASVDAFDINLDVNNNVFHTIASIICLDLPFCKNAIQDAIDGAIQKVIEDTVPGALAKQIAPALQAIADMAKCPGSADEESIAV
jgi:hypothetical protein